VICAFKTVARLKGGDDTSCHHPFPGLPGVSQSSREQLQLQAPGLRQGLSAATTGPQASSVSPREGLQSQSLSLGYGLSLPTSLTLHCSRIKRLLT